MSFAQRKETGSPTLVFVSARCSMMYDTSGGMTRFAAAFKKIAGTGMGSALSAILTYSVIARAICWSLLFAANSRISFLTKSGTNFQTRLNKSAGEGRPTWIDRTSSMIALAALPLSPLVLS